MGIQVSPSFKQRYTDVGILSQILCRNKASWPATDYSIIDGIIIAIAGWLSYYTARL
jgi:hypothetical protein